MLKESHGYLLLGKDVIRGEVVVVLSLVCPVCLAKMPSVTPSLECRQVFIYSNCK